MGFLCFQTCFLCHIIHYKVSLYPPNWCDRVRHCYSFYSLHCPTIASPVTKSQRWQLLHRRQQEISREDYGRLSNNFNTKSVKHLFHAPHLILVIIFGVIIQNYMCITYHLLAINGTDSNYPEREGSVKPLYHGCWWPGDANVQGIIDHCIELVLLFSKPN